MGTAVTISAWAENAAERRRYVVGVVWQLEIDGGLSTWRTIFEIKTRFEIADTLW